MQIIIPKSQKTTNPRKGIETVILSLTKSATSSSGQKTTNPRKGIETPDKVLPLGASLVGVRKQRIPARGLKHCWPRGRSGKSNRLVRKQRIPARGLKPYPKHLPNPAQSSQKTTNPRKGIETLDVKSVDLNQYISQKTTNPRKGIETNRPRFRNLITPKSCQKTTNPR